MIVSHDFKFIFLKSRKTGGSSFELALAKFLGAEDIITPLSSGEELERARLGYLGPQNHLARFHQEPLRVLANRLRGRQTMRFWNHTTALQARRRLPRKVWEHYTKFTLVRNPYELVISRFFWQKRKPGFENIEFQSWLISRPKILYSNRKMSHVRGNYVLDAFLRLEDIRNGFENSLDSLELPTGLGEAFIGLSSKSRVRPESATLETVFRNFPDGLKIVSEIFDQDFSLYGYERLDSI